MLDNYIEKQPIAYKILKNTILKNRVMHAYLIETKGCDNGLDIALSFAKYLLCPNAYTNNNKCDKCSICERIDENHFTEFEIIEPIGQVIKKEQLDSLQKNFSRKAIEGNRKVYIISQADKMNQSAANSILKFLEEPEENIVAILLVDNVYQLLNTIVSRCQIITLNNIEEKNTSMLEKVGSFLYDNENSILEYTQNADSEMQIKAVWDFIDYYEKNGLDTLLFSQKLWHDNFNDKIKVLLGLNIMLLFYKDILSYKLSGQVEYMLDYNKCIADISKKNKISDLINKINVIIGAREKVYQNINTSLLIDKLIIDMGCSYDKGNRC